MSAGSCWQSASYNFARPLGHECSCCVGMRSWSAVLAYDVLLESCAAQVLEGEELQLLEDTVQQYESAVGRALNFSDAPEPSASEPSAAALPVREGPEGASPAFRIHGADVQLTFNKTSWRAPQRLGFPRAAPFWWPSFRNGLWRFCHPNFASPLNTSLSPWKSPAVLQRVHLESTCTRKSRLSAESIALPLLTSCLMVYVRML